jgi:hypothetical protein
MASLIFDVLVKVFFLHSVGSSSTRQQQRTELGPPIVVRCKNRKRPTPFKTTVARYGEESTGVCKLSLLATRHPSVSLV